MEAGAVLSLLPPPPAVVLECGCGTGWFTWFLAKSGYTALGQDVARDAALLARQQPMFAATEGTASFFVGDFENLPFRSSVNAVVFMSALHHALKPGEALASAFDALVPGGCVVASEPGVGHHEQSKAVREQFDLTDEDMPPSLVARLGREVGFRQARMYPHAESIGATVYSQAHRGYVVASLASQVLRARRNGITVLVK